MICRKPHVASSICLRATIFKNPKGLCGHTVYRRNKDTMMIIIPLNSYLITCKLKNPKDNYGVSTTATTTMTTMVMVVVVVMMMTTMVMMIITVHMIQC
jgi:hypothetical protein